MSRLLLLDNDFILKIATLDLVGEFLALPFVKVRELRHLSSLPFMIKKGCLQNYTDAGLRRSLEWIGTFPAIEATSPQAIDRIPNLAGIDPGERLLLGSILELVESSIFTGDKRCITAIGGLPAALQDAFEGRILCLEAALRAILAHEDFDCVAGKVRPGLSCDRTMRSIFGSSAATSEESVYEGFASYLSDIASKPGGALLMSWAVLL